MIQGHPSMCLPDPHLPHQGCQRRPQSSRKCWEKPPRMVPPESCQRGLELPRERVLRSLQAMVDRGGARSPILLPECSP